MYEQCIVCFLMLLLEKLEPKRSTNRIVHYMDVSGRGATVSPSSCYKCSMLSGWQIRDTWGLVPTNVDSCFRSLKWYLVWCPFKPSSIDRSMNLTVCSCLMLRYKIRNLRKKGPIKIRFKYCLSFGWVNHSHVYYYFYLFITIFSRRQFIVFAKLLLLRNIFPER